jgi:hypothetical protein
VNPASCAWNCLILAETLTSLLVVSITLARVAIKRLRAPSSGFQTRIRRMIVRLVRLYCRLFPPSASRLRDAWG